MGVGLPPGPGRSTKSGTEIPENLHLAGADLDAGLAGRSTKSGTEIPENPTAAPRSRYRPPRALNEVRDRNPGEPLPGIENLADIAALAQRSPGPKSRRTQFSTLSARRPSMPRSTKSGTEIPENHHPTFASVRRILS